MTPSGTQHTIRLGEQEATVVEVGGGVRAYRVGQRDVLHPYDLDAMCDGAHGTPLIPWPNRLADGRYSFDGIAYQADITEVGKHNAIHGFLRWRNWRAADQGDAYVVMSHVLHPSSAYPFTLDVQVRYELSEAGLTVTTTARNAGDRACPYACGQHPYLSPGEGLIDEATLHFAATTRIDTDAARQLPLGLAPVAGSAFDFSAGRRIGDSEIDYAFTDVARDQQGRATVALTGTDGRTVDFWVGPEYPYIELFTAHTLSAARARRGLGCEPMTAPPNAFQTGQDVIRIEPGDQVTHTWGVGLRPA